MGIRKQLLTGYLLLVLTVLSVRARELKTDGETVATDEQAQHKLKEPIVTKINWQPVWDEQFEITHGKRAEKEDRLGWPVVRPWGQYPPRAKERSVSAEVETADKAKPISDWLPIWGDALNQQALKACDAPNGQGLKNLLRQSKHIIPLEKIRRIIRSAGKDTQVQALYKLLRSDDFRLAVAAMRKSTEYINMRDYMCYKLNLDAKDYLKFIKSIIDISVLDANSTAAVAADFPGRAGIRGMLLDIRAALPQQQLRDMFERLMSSDIYLARSVQRMRSAEFEMIFKRLRKTNEYVLVKRMLADVGVPLAELKELLDAALGWAGDEFVGEDLSTLI